MTPWMQTVMVMKENEKMVVEMEEVEEEEVK